MPSPFKSAERTADPFRLGTVIEDGVLKLWLREGDPRDAVPRVALPLVVSRKETLPMGPMPVVRRRATVAVRM
jgi:hypothetical protein